MKKAIFLITILTILASGFGVYSYFNKFHRSRNADAYRPQLIVSVTSSFMSPFGPGPEIAKEFSKICLCDVNYIDSGSGQVLFQKLKMGQVLDVVLGLDQVQLKQAAQNIKWKDLTEHERDWNKIFTENKYRTFLPYNWAPVSIVFREKQKLDNTNSFKELISNLPDQSLSLQDPRQSSLGLQLVYWTFLEAEQDLDKFSELAKLIKLKTSKVSSDWSASYGLFKRGLSQYVLSYMTSPLYHLKEENDSSYGAAQVIEGHPIQIEYAAVPDTCRSCALGKRFVEFLSSDYAQKLLYEKNYMFPVVNGVVNIPEVKALSSRPMDNFVDQREEILERWTKAGN